MLKSLFQTLGLGEKEEKAFMIMLEQGAQPVSKVAKQLQIPRSSTYVLLERLKEVGLVEEFEHRGVIQVKCIPVETIGDVIRIREREMATAATAFDKILPELQLRENRSGLAPSVKFFQGKEASLRMLDEVTHVKDFYGVFNPAVVKKFLSGYDYEISVALKRHKGKCKELLVDGPEAREYRDRFKSKRHQIKMLPKDVHFDSDIILTKDKIYMVAYADNEITATEIMNRTLAETQRTLFELLWKSILTS